MLQSASPIELQPLLDPVTSDEARPLLFLLHQLYEHLCLHRGSRCIRLLKLDHDPNNPHAALTGTLSVVDLRTSPAFTALSYAWGNFSCPRATITCQGCELDITDNCRDALLALRDQFGGLLIWVDAICINQDDMAEKSHQIQLCGEIYSCSKTVYVWLGKDDDNGSAAEAMERLKTVTSFTILPPRLPCHSVHQNQKIFIHKIVLTLRVIAAYRFYIPFGRVHCLFS